MLHSITPGQCRAARALLDITQTELAERASCGLSTVVDFEKSRRDVSQAAGGGDSEGARAVRDRVYCGGALRRRGALESEPLLKHARP